ALGIEEVDREGVRGPAGLGLLHDRFPRRFLRLYGGGGLLAVILLGGLIDRPGLVFGHQPFLPFLAALPAWRIRTRAPFPPGATTSSHLSSWPASNPSASRSSTRCRAAGTPAFLYSLSRGLLSLRSLTASKAIRAAA